MTVVPFVPNAASSWSAHELATLLSIYGAMAERGHASAWAVGATELGDPQFYVLGTGSDGDCATAISRVDRIYVREDGVGQVLDESASLEAVADRAKGPAKSRRVASVRARLTLVAAMLRHPSARTLCSSAAWGADGLPADECKAETGGASVHPRSPRP